MLHHFLFRDLIQKLDALSSCVSSESCCIVWLITNQLHPDLFSHRQQYSTTNSGTFDHPGSKTCSGHVQYMFMTRSKQCQNTFIQDAFFNHFNIFSYFEVYHLFKILIIFILPLFSYYFLLKEPYCSY